MDLVYKNIVIRPVTVGTLSWGSGWEGFIGQPALSTVKMVQYCCYSDLASCDFEFNSNILGPHNIK